jgi:cytochrome P450
MDDASPPSHGCPVLSYSPHDRRPIGDWTAFFDQLRADAPVVRNTFADGYYVLTGYEDILAAYQDPETFSTDAVTVFEPDPGYRWIPHMLGGDEHRQWRRLLGPAFAPKAVAVLDDRIRVWAAELIDALAGRGECDVLADFSFYYPTTIFLGLMGLPPEDLQRFMTWESSILHSHGSTPEEIADNRGTAMGAVLEYFRAVIAERRAHPGDDLISQAVGFEIDGRPVTDDEVTSYCFFMFMAGLDTVAAAFGYALYHFATHPSDRQRIVADPGLIPAAIEEILRVYAFTIPARKVRKDIEVGGCPIAAGSMVQLPIRAATRDPRAFPGGAEVRIDRNPNNHIAFGAGPHRCLGSHLARHELVIALEEWHKRIPDYRLADGAVILEVGRSSGPDSMPLRWLPPCGGGAPEVEVGVPDRGRRAADGLGHHAPSHPAGQPGDGDRRDRLTGAADRRGDAHQLLVGLAAVVRHPGFAHPPELRPQSGRLGDRLRRLPRHRGGHHRLDGVVVVGRDRFAERGAVGGLATAAPGRQPDRTHHDPFQVHHLGVVEDRELGGQPGARGERLQVRERGFVEPVPVHREGAELEHPQADAVAAVIAFQPADLAQLVNQPVQGRLRQPRPLVQVGQAQHLLSAVERLHDGRAPAQDGVLRWVPVAALVVPHPPRRRGHPGSCGLDDRCHRHSRRPLTVIRLTSL